ncbi:DUF6344 domain-containing protein [Streptomyces erythrochromogenes]|uniref:DUF6344 domain-containing protein n=1 Tax=Streptomyces erythrochromogenes TaxID=285574 RepID=A0ABZ1QD17_9ACTN|nr:DUF6344 domain-containing protein [Streptomyces erythrochromogenes]MCX5585839.1 DUF6344 domain-containing protein [Streptomyces erythrochromogenes]
MAHRNILTSIWTSVLAALVAVLSSLGFGGKVAPAAAASTAGGATATAATVAAAPVRRPAVTAPRSWREMMRGGSLPPTLKQRIRAEAHGKTPGVRRSTTAAAMGAAPGTAARVLTPSAVPAPRAPHVPRAGRAARATRETLALAA